MTNSRPPLLVIGFMIYAVLSLISMATMSIGAGILGICLLVSFGGPGKFFSKLRAELRQNPKARLFAWLSLGFAFACFLSLVCADLWPLSFGGKFSQVHLLSDSGKLWYFAWPFILWVGLRSCSVSQRNQILTAWFVTFGILSVIGIIQHYTGWPRRQEIPSIQPGFFHATLFMGHHLSVASSLIFPFFALLDLKNVRPLMKYLGVLMGAVMLFFTYSRMLWVALPAGLLFWGMLSLKNWGRCLLLVSLAVAIAIAYQVPAIHVRFFDQQGISPRETLWEANIRFFKDRPLTGVGLKHNEELSGYYLMDKFKTSDVFQGHAHNNVIDILGSTGAIGFLFFLAWWGFLFWILTALVRTPPGISPFFAKGLLAAFVVYQINGLTQVNFWEAKVQHQLMWMVAWVLLWSEGRVRE